MKRMKRILCLTLVLALSVALCACGKKDTAKNKGGNTEAPTTTTTVDDWAGNLEGDNMFNDGELDWG